MGTLAFFPWTTFGNPCQVGEFELRTVLLDPNKTNGREPAGHWAKLDDDCRRILSAYRNPPDIPLRSVTVVRFASKDPVADLSEAEIGTLFSFSEAVAFTGLSQRRFFEHSGYNNRDSFLLIVQRFIPGTGGVSLVQRRRHGTLAIGIPEELFVVRREPHIERLSKFDLDAGLAAIVLAEMDNSEEFSQAVRSFNEANTDRPSLTEAQELISTVSAFQQLFGIRNGSVLDTRQALLAAMKAVPTSDIAPKKQKAAERLSRRKNLRDLWMEDLCTLRGNVGHGHPMTAYPAIWTAKEHLLLAAYIFPLLVKLSLSNSGKWKLSSEDKFGLGLFDLLLASKNILGAKEDRHGVALQYEWNRIHRKGWRNFVGDW